MAPLFIALHDVVERERKTGSVRHRLHMKLRRLNPDATHHDVDAGLVGFIRDISTRGVRVVVNLVRETKGRLRVDLTR